MDSFFDSGPGGGAPARRFGRPPQAGLPPILRIDGELRTLRDVPPWHAISSTAWRCRYSTIVGARSSNAPAT